jgi:excisionase family DNA binding protein
MLQSDFNSMGMVLVDFNIRMGLHPESLEVVTRMGYGTTYTEMKTLDVGMAAAESGAGGGLGELGIGMMGLSAIQQQQAAQNQANQQQAAAQQQAGAQADVPAVMTPAQAAAIVQVGEADIVAAIEAGELKARKIGTAYRISKVSLEEFLSG